MTDAARALCLAALLALAVLAGCDRLRCMQCCDDGVLYDAEARLCRCGGFAGKYVQLDHRYERGPSCGDAALQGDD